VPNSSVGSVAVVGAAGFVGRALLRELERAGVRATAVVRHVTELSVDGTFHGAVTPADIPASGFDVVINLAYPTSGPAFEHPARDKAIRATVGALVRDKGRLIQVSSLAVFGFGLEHEPVLGPAPTGRDHPYVESKAATERHFAEAQRRRGLLLDIVRLGNVWGRASGSWVVPLVHRLLTGRPVGVRGVIAPSNTTDVVNAASYLAFLVRQGDDAAGVRYHHLAEFSDVPWAEWLRELSTELGWDPVYAERSVLEAPSTALGELKAALAPMKPRSVYRTLMHERLTGSWLRTFVRTLPPPLRNRLRGRELVVAPEPDVSRADRTFLSVLSAQREFRSSVLPDWCPPVTRDASLDGVLDWLREG
jgi:nucleoside-diphosphate-sugar epimerase